MSDLRTKMLGEAGQVAVQRVIATTGSMVIQLPEAATQSAIVLEVCLLEPGSMPVSYQQQTIWSGLGVEQITKRQKEYGHALARAPEIDTAELDFTDAGHYVLNVDGSELRVLVIVGGPPAEVCRKIARFTAAGVALAAHYLQ